MVTEVSARFTSLIVPIRVFPRNSCRSHRFLVVCPMQVIRVCLRSQPDLLCLFRNKVEKRIIQRSCQVRSYDWIRYLNSFK